MFWEGRHIQGFAKDKYGRTIADVLSPEGINVYHELVKDGWCWWCRKYAPADVILEELVLRARASRLGLSGRSVAGAAVGVAEAALGNDRLHEVVRMIQFFSSSHFKRRVKRRADRVMRTRL